jgi:hypothetical protein
MSMKKQAGLVGLVLLLAIAAGSATLGMIFGTHYGNHDNDTPAQTYEQAHATQQTDDASK